MWTMSNAAKLSNILFGEFQKINSPIFEIKATLRRRSVTTFPPPAPLPKSDRIFFYLEIPYLPCPIHP